MQQKNSLQEVVVKRVENTGICVVIPGSFHTQGINRVEWINETGGDIDILVPDGRVGARRKHLSHKPNGPDKGIDFIPQGGNGEEYPYAVYCHATRSFAVGGSEPEMIVP